jgi:hypothetical protein
LVGLVWFGLFVIWLVWFVGLFVGLVWFVALVGLFGLVGLVC